MAETNKSLHQNHRKRMRERYRENGFSGFSDHEILEMLLYRTNARSDTNGTAHLLSDAYDASLAHVLFDNIRHEIPGIGEKTEAMLLATAFSMLSLLIDTLRNAAVVTDHIAYTFFRTLSALPILPPDTAVILSCTLDGAFDAWRIVSLSGADPDCPDPDAFAVYLREHFAPARLFRIALHGDGFLADPMAVEKLRALCGKNYGFLKSCVQLP